jgi:AraC-like DNA-binding protein
MNENIKFLSHWHEAVEILYIVKGSISVISGHKWFTAEKGNILIVNSNNIHYIRGNAEYYCLIMGEKLCCNLGFGAIDNVVFRELISDIKIANSIIEIETELKDKKAHYKTAVKARLADIMIILLRDYALSKSLLSDNVQSAKTDMVKKAIKYIKEHYSERISTKDVARQAGVSEAHFCRIFKANTGFSVISYINLLRCYHARSLFLKGTHNVGEAAISCGFENISYFTKTYKKHIGSLPSADKAAAEDTE